MIFSLLLLLILPAEAAIKVVATTPEVAWLVHRIGREQVEVKTLAKAGDDYHFMEARPDYILSVARADLLCKIGADLESSWLPKVIEKAANQKLLKENVNCDLSKRVSLKEKREGKIDRSMGDVHASGNPHFWFSPSAMASASIEVEERLSYLLPEKASFFQKNREELQTELYSLQKKTQERLAKIKDEKLIEYHKDFSYFLTDFSLSSIGSIEEIPGVAPSAARIAQMAQKSQKEKVKMALATTTSAKNVLDKFQEFSKIPVVVVPLSLKEPAQVDAYSLWFQSIIEKMVKEF